MSLTCNVNSEGFYIICKSVLSFVMTFKGLLENYVLSAVDI